MTDDEEIRKLWATAGIHFSPAAFGMEGPQPVTLAGLRAVEAAVRADQIEKDAGLAESRHDVGWEGHELMTARFPDDGRRIAAAIRAQLTEGNTDE